MKRFLRSYAVIWAVLLALFNVLTFVAFPQSRDERFTASFWIGYSFITLAFIGQLVCAYFALKDDNAQKLFYNISLVSTSFSALALSFVVGGLCMVVSFLPYWVGIVACATALAVCVIAVIKTLAAVDLVSSVDEKVSAKTGIIKMLSADAQSLSAVAATAGAKEACERVYEALRYSDPVSVPALASLENEISDKLRAMRAVLANNDDVAVAFAERELLGLIAERNIKCKAYKQY